uniref:Putative secreted protein n=1 Tax=Ixodes ricinus TaxID=34613 RepID=A0A6B0U7A5_IXORI
MSSSAGALCGSPCLAASVTCVVLIDAVLSSWVSGITRSGLEVSVVFSLLMELCSDEASLLDEAHSWLSGTTMSSTDFSETLSMVLCADMTLPLGVYERDAF